jgi:hypothetical protein
MTPPHNFELHTIRPGSYPNTRIPAHVHFSLWGGGYPLQWVDKKRFASDPFVTDAMRAEAAPLGIFSALQSLTRGDDGIWQCSLKIRAGRECNFADVGISRHNRGYDVPVDESEVLRVLGLSNPRCIR